MSAPRGGISPKLIRWLMGSLGAVTLTVMLLEITVWWGIFGIFEPSFVAGVAMSLPAGLLMVLGSYRLPEMVISEHRYAEIAALTFGGTLVMGVFSLIVGIALLPQILLAYVGSVRWGIAIGGGVGFLFGLLHARGIERAVIAETAAVRAEKVEEQRELLDYLNALLRHEVLNTANIIGGMAELVEQSETDAERRRRTGIIQRQSAELTAVIEDVRFLTEILSTEDPSLRPMDVEQVLETELAKLHDRHEDVETELSVPGDTQVAADPLLPRVFSNLLSNAAEHNEGERKRVSVSADPDEEMVAVRIRDDGPGIPERERDSLFEPTVEPGANHGLGLTIVTRLVERYSGEVNLVETGSQGTTIEVRLPRMSSVVMSDGDGGAGTDRADASAPADGSSLSVVTAEDEDPQRSPERELSFGLRPK